MEEQSRPQYLPQDPIPIMPEHAIRVVIPAKVAFNIGNLHTAIDNLARELGCQECFSGRSCYFQLQHQFIVNPESLEVRGLGG